MPELEASLRDLRVQAGWSLRGLAAHTGVSATAIGMIERGKQTPRWVTLCRLAEALQLDADELAARFGQPDPSPTSPHTWESHRVGVELARWRAWAGDSQPELATVADCAVDVVRQVEQGHRILPVMLARVAGKRYGFDIAAALAAAGYDTELPHSCEWSAGEFAQLWPRLRRLAGVSVRQVADVVGVSHAAVGYWGERDREPTDAQLEPLAGLLTERLAWHPTIATVDTATLAEALGHSRRRASPTPPHAGRPRRVYE